MSNKFLNSGGNITIDDLDSGTLVIYGSQLQAANLIPNFPIKADANNKLYSTLLGPSDINGVLVTPYNGIIEATDFETEKYFSINNQLQYINNFEDSTATTTNITGSLNVTSQIVVPKITDLTETVRIELDDTDVNVIGQNFTFNGLDVLTGTIPNLQDLEDKTFHIQLPLNPLGTIFGNNIYADAYVKTGGTNQQYLMADGASLQYSANSGNSNFYLYNNGTDNDPTPANGFITYNTIIQDNATFIYINHRTRDTIDIEVFFKNLSTLNDVYIQDQENSDNNITYNITGNPIIINQAQVTIPVIKRTSNGTGQTTFGNGHNILLSFFTNSIETDIRLSNLETKSQNIESTASKLTLNRSLELKINDTTDFLAIRSLDGLSNYLIMTDTNTDIYTDVNLNGNDLTDIGSLVIAGGTNLEFLKADGTLDDNDYIQATDIIITNLQNKTQLITATFTRTIFNKSSQCRLTNLDNFSVTLDVGLDTFPKFVISGFLVNSLLPMTMSNNKLYGIPIPTDNDDAVNKLYVDNADASKLDVSGGTLFGTLSMSNNKITLIAEPTASTDAVNKSYVDNSIMIKLQARQIVTVVTSGLTETVMTTTASSGSYSWADTAVGQSRTWRIYGTQTRSNFSSTYTIRFKSGSGGTTLNVAWVLPNSNSGSVSNQPFILEITTVRTFANSLSYYAKFSSVEATSAGYYLSSSQNQSGGILPIDQVARYNITVQSSIGSASLQFNYIEVVATLN